MDDNEKPKPMGQVIQIDEAGRNCEWSNLGAAEKADVGVMCSDTQCPIDPTIAPSH